MKVLTLREPWASLVGERIKTIETRSWPTNYRGELYIHADTYKIPKKDVRANELASWLSGALNYGYIFAKCNLVDCIRIDKDFAEQIKKIDMRNFLCGDYATGRYAWILADIEYISVIPAKGHLGIWNVEY